jgi:hypothetical protein
VSSWDFNNVNLTFSGGSGGAGVDHWVAEKLNSGGGVVASQSITTGSFGFGVSANEQCQFRVYAVSTGGITSKDTGGPGYSNTVRTLIGHPEQGHNISVQNTASWSSTLPLTNLGAGAHRGEAPYILVPSGYYMTQWTHSYALSFPGTYIAKPPAQGNRQIQYYNTRDGSPGTVPYWDRNIAAWATDTWTEGISNLDGQGIGWGIYLSGVGWTAPGLNDAQILKGSFRLDGFYYYYTSQWVVDVAYAGNSYW